MNRKINWGVLSTAKIGTHHVIPSMQKSSLCNMMAISSRNIETAKKAAEQLSIPTYYGSYEELLSDPSIEAIYNPLPNHLHIPWTIKALEAGKHVLCEKPISLTKKEANELLVTTKKYPHLKVMEAFMYRFHPQWVAVKKVIESGKIGEIRHIHSVFGFYNVDPTNVRNNAAIGGGALMDVGCYCVNLSRFIYESEPVSIKSVIDRDPNFGTDRVTSGLLEFEQGAASFMCSTQIHFQQEATITGSKGLIKLNIPFNASNDLTRKMSVTIDGETETIFFESCDQYLLQGKAFSKAIIEDSPVPTPIEDAIANMDVIDQLFSNS